MIYEVSIGDVKINATILHGSFYLALFLFIDKIIFLILH